MKDQPEVVKQPVVGGDSSAQFRERQDVIHFHQKFGVPVATEPSFLNCEAYAFRVKFMQEELDEFREAHSTGDMHGAADALVDLVYVVQGTAHMMGLPWPLLWSEVQRANITKVRATDASQSKRGTALDVIKPPGWVAPDHTAALGKGPWPTLRDPLQVAVAWLNTAGERLLADVRTDFVTQDFCQGLTPEQAKRLFTEAMHIYVREES